MKKFLVLLKKEIKELLTPQMLAPLLIAVLIFFGIGKVVGKEAAKTQASQPIEILDLDNSATSRDVLKMFENANFTVTVSLNGDIQNIINTAKQKSEKNVLVIPSGFEAGVNNLTPQKIKVYTIMENFSLTNSINQGALGSALALVNNTLSNRLIISRNPTINPVTIKQPITTDDFVIVGNKQANVSPTAVSSFISSQVTFIPIILFIVIVLASQLIAVSISSEKENKTLETLLSSPINRQYIVAAKLLAAGIVSLISAVIYLLGMRSYMNNLTSSFSTQTATSEAAKAAIAQLGLNFSVGNYLLLGLALFFGILSALSVAIVLGVFAEDTKGAQGVITPLMLLILVPYFLTLFLDISSLSPAIRFIVYIIPFTHTFLAATNILLGHYLAVWLGILYLAVFFLVFVYIASRIFSSDKIFTLKLNFRMKR